MHVLPPGTDKDRDSECIEVAVHADTRPGIALTKALPISWKRGSRGSSRWTQQYRSWKAHQLSERIMRACGRSRTSASGTKPANAGNTGVIPRLRMRRRILRCSSAEHVKVSMVTLSEGHLLSYALCNICVAFQVESHETPKPSEQEGHQSFARKVRRGPWYF